VQPCFGVLALLVAPAALPFAVRSAVPGSWEVARKTIVHMGPQKKKVTCLDVHLINTQKIPGLYFGAFLGVSRYDKGIAKSPCRKLFQKKTTKTSVHVSFPATFFLFYRV
jgi:hypothetical protein